MLYANWLLHRWALCENSILWNINTAQKCSAPNFRNAPQFCKELSSISKSQGAFYDQEQNMFFSNLWTVIINFLLALLWMVLKSLSVLWMILNVPWAFSTCSLNDFWMISVSDIYIVHSVHCTLCVMNVLWVCSLCSLSDLWVISKWSLSDLRVTSEWSLSVHCAFSECDLGDLERDTFALGRVKIQKYM